jgi:hypothetical protein
MVFLPESGSHLDPTSPCPLRFAILRAEHRVCPKAAHRSRGPKDRLRCSYGLSALNVVAQALLLPLDYQNNSRCQKRRDLAITAARVYILVNRLPCFRRACVNVLVPIISWDF